MRKASYWGIVGWLGLSAASAWAQDTNLPWQEYERLIEKGRTVAPLEGDGMFGDSVDLYSGALSFSVTDVSIPGNSGLPVAIGRKLTIYNRKNYGSSHAQAFADWDIDVPNVNGVFGPTWHDNRCSTPTPPALVAGAIQADEYWTGNHAAMPGGGEMLQANIVRPKPSTGGPYLWLTSGDVYFSCLGSIQNGTGQGFLAITKDGTKYWFNYMAQYAEPKYWKKVGQSFTPAVTRRKNALYATRVEDRFGNWVQYAYSNAYNQPVRLNSITSSDGRSLSLQYNASGFVSSVSDGTRSWTYQYSAGHLTAVVLPDTSRWQFNMAALTDAVIQLSEDNGQTTCESIIPSISGDVSGSITHPSGAVGTFTVGVRQVGRSNVPKLCANWQAPGTPGNNQGDDFPIIPYQWETLALKSRQIHGPAIPSAVWTYAYGYAWSWDLPPGHTEPVCKTQSCLDPFCTSDSCAGTRGTTITGPNGTWQRYTFGNSYRYNEGKLLAHEQGGGPTSVIKTSAHTYNYATSGQNYAPRIGTSPQPRGLGFVDEYPRPLVKTETLQDGGLFVWEVAKGCPSAGVYCLDTLIRPTKVVKTGTVAGTVPGTTLVIAPTQTPVLTAPATNSTGSFTVSWGGVSLATSYQLQERLGSGSWSTIQDSGSTSRLISGKATGSWGYQVRGCNTAGCTAWSAAKTTVVTRPPTGVPTVTAPASNTTGGYTVSWTSVATAARYELEQRKDGGAWSNIHNASAISKVLSGQAVGTYNYRVRACNNGGCAGWSSMATTVVSQALGIPTLTVTPSPATQEDWLTASWTSVSGANQYQLESRFNSGNFENIYAGAATSTTFPAGMWGTWQFRVRACNGGACGGYSAAKTVIVNSSWNLVAPEAPEAPEGAEDPDDPEDPEDPDDPEAGGDL